MAGFTVTADMPVFDGDAWKLLMQAQLEVLFQNAAREFLRAASSRIPVRTGFLRGSFSTLADAVRPVELLPVIPRTSRPEYYRHAPRTRRILKTPISGRPFTTDPIKIFLRAKRTSSGKSLGIDGLYTFNYSNLIRYLEINDKRLGWNAWTSGRLAFDNYINANLKNSLPEITRFTLITRTTLRGTTISERRQVGTR